MGEGQTARCIEGGKDPVSKVFCSFEVDRVVVGVMVGGEKTAKDANGELRNG